MSVLIVGVPDYALWQYNEELTSGGLITNALMEAQNAVNYDIAQNALVLAV